MANTPADAAAVLSGMRRLLRDLPTDDKQQWPLKGADRQWPEGESDETREVWVVDQDRIAALLERADCGGQG